MDSSMRPTRVRDSQRYVNMDNNYQYMKCRSVVNYKGAANGDIIDRNHADQSKIKNFKNYEKQW